MKKPDFKGTGDRRQLVVDYVIGLGVPLSVLCAVLLGTQHLSETTYTLTGYFSLPFYVLIAGGALKWYLKRFGKGDAAQTRSFILLGMALSAAIVILSLPHLPLGSFWHAPAPGTNIALLILVELPLAISLLVIHFRRSKEK